ncbi:MAG: hypothetical protein LBI34_01170 [Puniceicoccales bacterium]|jgi:hypothetical protein|nr:hypothetical protein [Puniceicoccales bacterium]
MILSLLTGLLSSAATGNLSRWGRIAKIGNSVGKIFRGIFAKSQANGQAELLNRQGSIQNNLARSNLLGNFTQNYGDALVAANRAGDYSPGTLSGSFNNLAADMRQTNYNRRAAADTAQALQEAGSAFLLDGLADGFSGIGNGTWSKKLKNVSGKISLPLTGKRRG